MPAGYKSAYQGATVLVLGASGFIGRRVTRMLCDCDARVVAVSRKPTFPPGRVQEQIADLATAGTAAELLDRIAPVVVFNLAGYGVDPTERDDPLSERINHGLVDELCRSVLPRPGWPGQCLVHAGSALEFGVLQGDFSDPWNCRPTTTYGRTKLKGCESLRDLTRQRNVRAVAARLFTVYGPGEHEGRLLPSLIAAARKAETLELTPGLQQRDFTYVDDVAEGLLRLGAMTDDFAPRALNLASGTLTSVREFATRAFRALRADAGLLRFGALPVRPAEMAHLPVAIEATERLLQWRPETDIEAGVSRTFRELHPDEAQHRDSSST